MMETGSIRTYKVDGIEEMDEIESVGYYRWPLYSSTKNLKEKKMYGGMRVFVLLIGVFVLPATLIILPLYLKYRVFGDFHFIVTESDVFKITDGVSPIFCEAHLLHMEGSTFNAFQTKSVKISSTRKKHLRLYKNFSLANSNEQQIWSFFLRKGTTISLKVCSRSERAQIMIVEDMKEFRTCGLLNNAKKWNSKAGDDFAYETVDVDSLNKSSFQEQNHEHMSSRLGESVDGRLRIANHLDEYALKKFLKICYEGRTFSDRPTLKSHYRPSLQEKEDFTTLIEHEVLEDNYYSYIIYGVTESEIQVSLDVFKPIFEYSDYQRVCLNKSHCIFPLSFTSREEVVAEIQIRDGTESGANDRPPFVLVSSCQPRRIVYLAFAATVLFAILLFAFI